MYLPIAVNVLELARQQLMALAVAQGSHRHPAQSLALGL